MRYHRLIQCSHPLTPPNDIVGVEPPKPLSRTTIYTTPFALKAQPQPRLPPPSPFHSPPLEESHPNFHLDSNLHCVWISYFIYAFDLFLRLRGQFLGGSPYFVEKLKKLTYTSTNQIKIRKLNHIYETNFRSKINLLIRIKIIYKWE